MEFQFSINNLFAEEFSLVDNKLVPRRKSPRGNSVSSYREQLMKVIDKMGDASAKAQGLNATITSASKLQFSDHHLYFMIDAQANNGLGAVVGMIKVGQKKLFVYDHNGIQHECEPLCVLDFYVHESRQRHGCGKKIFEHILQVENVKPQHLAIDRPSTKFSNFLKKHYKFRSSIPQVNNFVVFEGFFKDRPPDPDRRKSGYRPQLHHYKKHSRSDVWKERGAGGDIQSSDGRGSSLSNSSIPLTQHEKEKEALMDVSIPKAGSKEALNTLGQIDPLTGTKRSSSLNVELNNLNLGPQRALGAQNSMYSRHQISPLARQDSGGPAGQAGGVDAANQSPKGMQQGLLGVRRGSGGPGRPGVQTTFPEKPNRPAAIDPGTSDPPMLRRDGPPTNYLGLQAYQDRRGHLRLAPSATNTAPPPELGQNKNQNNRDESQGDSRLTSAKAPLTLQSSWNVLGQPPRYVSPSNRTTSGNIQNRLW
ncbi:unnamed protein product [Owenia fusiformis]|uniref:Alpha-tubulin N-acetyltransferase n=1 Tax=Owenia fusiformis TaxID=6347 RepID=A0A8J1UCU1_OWEFU|nr:unnamed protein product [Owenia fusiformis]